MTHRNLTTLSGFFGDGNLRRYCHKLNSSFRLHVFVWCTKNMSWDWNLTKFALTSFFENARRTCCSSVKYSTISINYSFGIECIGMGWCLLHPNNNYFRTDDNHFSLWSIFSHHVVLIEFQFEPTPAHLFVQSILFTFLLFFLVWQIKNAKFMA